jgi:hypothetical protein
MRKLLIRFIAAFLTFLIGIAVSAIWLFSRPPKQEFRVSIPNERWVHIAFEMPGLASRSINEITGEAGLENLRAAPLPGGDLEVRAWSGFGIDGKTYGVILRRSAGRWSVVHLYEPGGGQRVQVYEDSQAVPKSGWDKAWGELVGAGILTLPDASAIQCRAGVVDGVGYIVEVNANRSYRTYMYDNPEYAKCGEAKQMIGIADIIEDEFGWKDSRVRG